MPCTHTFFRHEVYRDSGNLKIFLPLILNNQDNLIVRKNHFSSVFSGCFAADVFGQWVNIMSETD